MNISDIKKINGSYNKTLKQSYIDDLVNQYNIADENVITKFTALVNSNKGKNVTRYRELIGEPIRVLMEYKNNKNTTNSNYYIEVQSRINDVSHGDLLNYYDDISDRNDYYLCLSKPMRTRDYDLNYVVNCNQTLNWRGLDKPIPCWCDNSSYGTKGTIDTNYLIEYDGKILFYTQYNEKTKQIKQDMRFIFDNNKDSAYQVVDVNRVVTGNVLRIVMDKTKADERDDVENNIAYNNFLEGDTDTPTPSQGYLIKSYTDAYEINKWVLNMFTVCNDDGAEDNEKWNITVDYNGNPESVIIINSITDNSITIKNNGVIGTSIILKFTKGDIELIQEVRLVK